MVSKASPRCWAKTSADVFPSALGRGYTEQDLRVLREGVTLRDQLEMHLYNGRERGWCLTQKLALRDISGQVIGMAGISHDLQEAHARHPAWQRLAIVDDHIRRHYHRPIAMEELTALSGMSIAQIERYCKRIFHLTPRQMIHKVRLEKKLPNCWLAIRRLPISPCSAGIPITAPLAASSRR